MRYNKIMYNTRKITQGAMLLSLVGALMMANRYLTASYFDDMAFLPQTLVIIFYGVACGKKEAWMLSFGMAIITFLFGGQIAWLLHPIAIITANSYVHGVSKKWKTSQLFWTTLFFFVVGELIVALLSIPLLGLDFAKLIEEVRDMTIGWMGSTNVALFPPAIFDKLILMSFVFVSLFTSFLEAILIHFLALYLLKRFRLYQAEISSLADKSFPAVYSYMALLMVSSGFFLFHFLDQEVMFIMILCLVIIGGFYLCLLGFLFLIVWGKIYFGRNIAVFAFLLLLLVPQFLIFILLMGFLYGSGPLKQYIDKIRGRV